MRTSTRAERVIRRATGQATARPAQPAVAGEPAWRPSQTVPADERALFLARVGIFRDVAPESLHSLANRLEEREYSAGTYVVRAGDQGDGLFFIVSGRAEVIGRAEDERGAAEATLAHMGPGDLFGEVSLLDGKPRSASVLACTDSICLFLGRDPFLTALSSERNIAMGLLGLLAERLREADRRVVEGARDPLTSTYNRRGLEELYQREAERVKRHGGSVAVVYIDINGFKYYNDQWGHAAGDRVLCAVGTALQHAVRAADIVARHGGDEFILVLPQSDAVGAERAVERIRECIEHVKRTWELPAPVVVGIGYAVAQGTAVPLPHLLAEADQAMYRDKARIRASERG